MADILPEIIEGASIPEAARPKYDLADDDLQRLTSRLFAEQPPRGDAWYVCYKFDGTTPYADIGRRLEHDIFRQAFAGNDASFFEREYGPYDQASMFFVSFDRQTQEPVGTLRVIKESPAGYKTLNDIARPDVLGISTAAVMQHHRIDDLSDVWDIGTVGVLPRYRSARMEVSLQLYRALYASAVGAEDGDRASHFVSVIDKAALNQLKKFLGIPFNPICGSPEFSYLGSEQSRAVYGYVPEFYEKMDSRRRLIDSLGVLAMGKMKRKQSLLLAALDRLMDGGGGMDESLQFPLSIEKPQRLR